LPVNTTLVFLGSLLVGYLLGGIPFASIVARLRGVDIMKVGTRNPGLANVFREVGPAEGVLAGVLDMGKGTLAVLVARWLGLSADVALGVGAAAVVGHCYSPFLRFKGGAGLATAVGAAFGVLPVLASIGVAAAGVIILWRRNVGVAAGVAYTAALSTGLGLGRPLPLIIGVAVIAVAVMVRNYLLTHLAKRQLRLPPPFDPSRGP